MVQIDASHFSRDASVELSEALAKPVSYKLMYFRILGNGSTGRDLLAYGGVEWSAIAPAVRCLFVNSDAKGKDILLTSPTPIFWFPCVNKHSRLCLSGL